MTANADVLRNLTAPCSVLAKSRPYRPTSKSIIMPRNSGLMVRTSLRVNEALLRSASILVTHRRGNWQSSDVVSKSRDSSRSYMMYSVIDGILPILMSRTSIVRTERATAKFPCPLVSPERRWTVTKGPRLAAYSFAKSAICRLKCGTASRCTRSLAQPPRDIMSFRSVSRSMRNAEPTRTILGSSGTILRSCAAFRPLVRLQLTLNPASLPLWNELIPPSCA
mmetsp:Transcript_18452/g.62231  ORF Transcript_18452/g.62231 Transcript_18452/m.62231 type:complete len:223 (-) Transcript_18452:452-1120(-)